MNLLFTGYLSKLLVLGFLLYVQGGRASAAVLFQEEDTTRLGTDIIKGDDALDSVIIMPEKDVFEALFHVAQNKKKIESKVFQKALAKSLVYEGKIREFVGIDSYIFKQAGLKNELLKVLNEAAKLASNLTDNNEKFFNLSLIEATIAGLSEELNDKLFWYANSYRHHTLIEKDTEQFNDSKLVGMTSHAMTFHLSEKNEKAKEEFLQATAYIDPNNLEKHCFYLLSKFVSFLKEGKSYSEVEKWLDYKLTLADKEEDEFVKAVTYYDLMLLKIKEGKTSNALWFLSNYLEAKKKVGVKDIVKLAYMENSYYELTNNAFGKGDNKLIVFLMLTGLTVCGMGGMFLYVNYWKSHFKQESVSGQVIEKEKVEPKMLASTEYRLIEKDIAVTHEEISYLKKMAENGDPLFMKKFKELHEDFIDCLNKSAISTLNLAELEICAFTKLGYTTKEVAYYRGDSIRSVENRKYRIRRKLNLPGDTDFTEWFLSI